MPIIRYIVQNTRNKIFDNHYVFSALVKDLNMGTCNVNVSGKVAYLNNIYVKPEFRNKQVGSLLLQYTEDFLWNSDVSFINLRVLSDNTNYTKDFYIKNKYNVTHTEGNIYDDGENIFDMIHMNKIKDMGYRDDE